jgi:predicted AAA+ superfamily ATPase
MQTIERKAISYLVSWRRKKKRKPLVLRGARQVGKTTLVYTFSAQYKQFIYLNLELQSDRQLFSEGKDVKILLQQLLLRDGKEEALSDILLFIDEIQESTEAIAMLRYFYEELPELSVIAAGSLLEFALGAVKNFPVGRVEFYYLHPLNFEEFLLTLGKQKAINTLHMIPFPDFALDELFSLFNLYCLTGGMPELVATFYENNQSLASLLPLYQGLWQTYQDDVAKYTDKPTEQKLIRHVLNTAPIHFDQRITFQNFGKSTFKSREVGDAFRQIHNAGLVRLIYPSTGQEAPLIPDFAKSPRLQFLDTGLLLHRLGLQSELLGLHDLSDAARGAIIPHMVFQERIAMQEHTDQLPLFWVREKAQSSAEVDYLLVNGSKVIPVEIKSGKIGKLRSLHVYMDSSPADFAFRLHYGPVRTDQVVTTNNKTYKLLSLPYFLAAYLEYYLHID